MGESKNIHSHSKSVHEEMVREDGEKKSSLQQQLLSNTAAVTSRTRGLTDGVQSWERVLGFKQSFCDLEQKN